MISCLLPVLLAAVVFTNANPPERNVNKHQVIVVGAGVAGFAAAATLLESNITDVLVLEASNRIGGRIHTVEFGNVYLDKGAEFVHGEVDNAVYEMVSPYNLLKSYKITLQADMYLFVNTSGDVFNSTLVKSLIDEAYKVFEEEGIQHFNGSLADYFLTRLDELLCSKNTSRELGEALRHLVYHMENSNTADDLSLVGPWGYSQFIWNEGDITLKWRKGGYNIFFDFLSKRFPNSIDELPVKNKTILGKQVVRIEREKEDVEVTCADGSSYLANHVIFTPSLGVLKKHAAAMFHPPLSVEKTTAIETLGFGCVDKVFLLFPHKWWPNDTNVIMPLFSHQELQEFRNTSAHGSWSSDTTGFYHVMNHDRMLISWFSGNTCRTMETLSEDQITEGLMELLVKFLGKKFDIPKPESILRSRWASDPYILGSYSYSTVSSDQQNITHSHLAQPIQDRDGKPVILFAGEATHPHYYSTVHGALASGRREARRILNYLNKALPNVLTDNPLTDIN